LDEWKRLSSDIAVAPQRTSEPQEQPLSALEQTPELIATRDNRNHHILYPHSGRGA